MADESVFDHHDAERLIHAGGCDEVNIKFSKSGGIAEPFASMLSVKRIIFLYDGWHAGKQTGFLPILHYLRKISSSMIWIQPFWVIRWIPLQGVCSIMDILWKSLISQVSVLI